MAHAEREHVGSATFGSAQLAPHVPQLFGSFAVSAQ